MPEEITKSTDNQEQPLENSSDVGSEIETPKKKLKVSPLLIILGILIFIVAGVFIYLVATSDPILKRKEPEPEPPVVITEPEPENPVKTVVSDEFNFSVEYNEDLHDFEKIASFSSEPVQFLISHKGSKQGELEIESDLVDGYIVKILAFRGIEREILDLAQRKKTKFTLECPGIVEIGNTYRRAIDGVEVVSFEVINCPQNYIVNFAEFKGNIIEIDQIYRGDLGFKQSYRAQTQEIVDTFTWSRDPEEDPEIESFEDVNYQISFIHPVLDTKCCAVTPPSIENLNKIVVLADPSRTDAEGNVLDKVGIYALDSKSKSFELFLNEQKQALIQEYRVVEEKAPTNLTEKDILIGGSDAVRLENYAWWGDIIYMKHPKKNAFLIFVIPDGISKSFSNTIEEVFETFIFDKIE